MIISNVNTERRLKILQLGIDEIKECYDATLRDTYLDVGLEYNKKYPYPDDGTLNLIKKAEELKKLRELKLYTSIFNFTQIFYSVKEFLLADFPQYKIDIENFFSNEKVSGLSRTRISNDLKHNSKKDLEYKSILQQLNTDKELNSRSKNISF